MALTGWTYQELRDQPAPVVRGLMHRIFATRAWDPGLASQARRPVARSAYQTAGAWGEAVQARNSAAKSLATVEALLWPEDRDGED